MHTPLPARQSRSRLDVDLVSRDGVSVVCGWRRVGPRLRLNFAPSGGKVRPPLTERAKQPYGALALL